MHILKQGSFVSKKFNKLLLGYIWGCLANSIALMTDAIINGNQLGETALEAVTILYPLISISYFFGELISSGSSIIFGKYIGEFEEEKAHKAAGSSICFSALIGIISAFIFWLIKMPLLSYLGCSGKLLNYASDYYNWLILYAAIYPIYCGFYYLLVTDGESVLISLAAIINIVSNVVLSIVLARIYGISGLGMASCIGLGLGLLCLVAHLLRKSNNIKLKLCMDFKIIGKSIVLSFSNYMYFLFLAIVDIIFNKIIITYCGLEYIPAYSVVNLVFSVCEVFLCLFDSSAGFITCFYGEKNNHGLNIIFKKLASSTLIMSVFLTAFFFFGAPLMPVIYGLETPVTIKAAIMASRIMSFTTLGFGLNYIFGMVMSSVEKPFRSFFLSFLCDGFAPILLSLILGSLWNFTGIIIGMCLSTYFAILIYSLTMLLIKGKKGYPVYVEDFGEEGFSYDIYVTPNALVELRNAASNELKAHGYDIKNIDLLLEEFFTRVMEKNPQKTVIAECSLLFGEKHVRILIRDDGVLFNFVDENNKIESLNTHVLNSLLLETKEKNYMITTAFNRNGFIFEK